MSDLAYLAPQSVSALLTLLQKVSPLVSPLPKVSPLVRQIHPHVARLFNDRCQPQLLVKKLLQAKLHEFYLANVGVGEVE